MCCFYFQYSYTEASDNFTLSFFSIRMNPRTETSIVYANQRNYLDNLFHIYPTIPEWIRIIDETLRREVEKSFKKHDNTKLIETLLDFDLFPIKDSYVAYLKRDRGAIERNPNTVARLCGRLYEMGLDQIREKCSEPKETNRQIWPLFKRWISSGGLWIIPVKWEEFLNTKGNAILDASDTEMMLFAKKRLWYKRNKGLDFVGRFNEQYVIGEAKFLTDFGGHQNAQFVDAISTLTYKGVRAIKIAILDGVLYIKGHNKMYTSIITTYKKENIMSALVLREFLYQL